jgi:hypothetical protein
MIGEYWDSPVANPVAHFFKNFLMKILEKVPYEEKKTKSKFLFDTVTCYRDIWIQVFSVLLTVHAYFLL